MVFFESIPAVAVIASGIVNGVKGIAYAVLLFFVVILFYASLGHALFSDNDPYNFGTFAISVVAFFQMSTFENWATILYINSGGCDSYSSVYNGLAYNTSQVIQTYWGTFELPLCKTPVARPVESVCIFVTFAFIAGYLLVNISLATVAIGFKERLGELRVRTVYGERKWSVATVSNIEGRKSLVGKNKKAANMFGTENESKQIVSITNQIWGEQSALYRAKHLKFFAMETNRVTNIFRVNCKLPHNVDDFFRSVDLAIKNGIYDSFMTCVILTDAIIQLITASRNFEDQASDNAHIFFQVVFLIDLVVRSSLFYHKGVLKVEVLNFWFIFEILVTALTLIPSVVDTDSSLRPLGSLRLLRILKALKNFSFLTDLFIILGAFESSILPMLYIVSLLCIMYFIFAVAGVLLFKRSAPFHFGTIGSSLYTLLQMMVQDNWSDIMRICMYGCAYYGYDTGIIKFDSLCDVSQRVKLSELKPGDRTPGSGVGWVAPIFFIIFIICSAMVLIGLFVGVMITSMEMLREEASEIKEMSNKVEIIKTRYTIGKENMIRLLELFEKADIEHKGYLKFQDLNPIFELLHMDQSIHFEFFMRVDADGNGTIDFAEFCEMIILIGIARAEVETGVNDKGETAMVESKGPNLSGDASAIVALEHGNKNVINTINHAATEANCEYIQGLQHAAEELHFFKGIIDEGYESSLEDDDEVYDSGSVNKTPRVKPSHSTTTGSSSSSSAVLASTGGDKDKTAMVESKGANLSGNASAIVALEHGNKNVINTINHAATEANCEYIQGLQHAAEELHFFKGIIDEGYESSPRLKPSYSTTFGSSSYSSAALANTEGDKDLAV